MFYKLKKEFGFVLLWRLSSSQLRYHSHVNLYEQYLLQAIIHVWKICRTIAVYGQYLNSIFSNSHFEVFTVNNHANLPGCCSIGVVHLECAAVEVADILASSDGFLSRDLNKKYYCIKKTKSTNIILHQ